MRPGFFVPTLTFWIYAAVPIFGLFPGIALAQQLHGPIGEAAAGSGSHSDLSPWSMFLNADRVVQAVIVGLAFASLVVWTIALAKAIELGQARRRLMLGQGRLRLAATLRDAARGLDKAGDDLALLIRAAESECALSGEALPAKGIKERAAQQLERLVAACGRRMVRSTGLLATIGATGPFVGLFGTVWGIMNSFIGISRAQSTNLAVVAPGIAEALLATAIGLVAAIPAVVLYNVFARAIGGYRARLTDAASDVLRLVSRDLDRAAVDGARFRKAAE